MDRAALARLVSQYYPSFPADGVVPKAFVVGVIRDGIAGKVPAAVPKALKAFWEQQEATARERPQEAAGRIAEVTPAQAPVVAPAPARSAEAVAPWPPLPSRPMIDLWFVDRNVNRDRRIEEMRGGYHGHIPGFYMGSHLSSTPDLQVEPDEDIWYVKVYRDLVAPMGEGSTTYQPVAHPDKGLDFLRMESELLARVDVPKFKPGDFVYSIYGVPQKQEVWSSKWNTINRYWEHKLRGGNNTPEPDLRPWVEPAAVVAPPAPVAEVARREPWSDDGNDMREEYEDTTPRRPTVGRFKVGDLVKTLTPSSLHGPRGGFHAKIQDIRINRDIAQINRDASASEALGVSRRLGEGEVIYTIADVNTGAIHEWDDRYLETPEPRVEQFLQQRDIAAQDFTDAELVALGMLRAWKASARATQWKRYGFGEWRPENEAIARLAKRGLVTIRGTAIVPADRAAIDKALDRPGIKARFDAIAKDVKARTEEDMSTYDFLWNLPSAKREWEEKAAAAKREETASAPPARDDDLDVARRLSLRPASEPPPVIAPAPPLVIAPTPPPNPALPNCREREDDTANDVAVRLHGEGMVQLEAKGYRACWEKDCGPFDHFDRQDDVRSTSDILAGKAKECGLSFTYYPPDAANDDPKSWAYRLGYGIDIRNVPSGYYEVSADGRQVTYPSQLKLEVAKANNMKLVGQFAIVYLAQRFVDNLKASGRAEGALEAMLAGQGDVANKLADEMVAFAPEVEGGLWSDVRKLLKIEVNEAAERQQDEERVKRRAAAAAPRVEVAPPPDPLTPSSNGFGHEESVLARSLAAKHEIDEQELIAIARNEHAQGTPWEHAIEDSARRMVTHQSEHARVDRFPSSLTDLINMDLELDKERTKVERALEVSLDRVYQIAQQDMGRQRKKSLLDDYASKNHVLRENIRMLKEDQERVKRLIAEAEASKGFKLLDEFPPDTKLGRYDEFSSWGGYLAMVSSYSEGLDVENMARIYTVRFAVAQMDGLHKTRRIRVDETGFKYIAGGNYHMRRGDKNFWETSWTYSEGTSYPKRSLEGSFEKETEEYHVRVKLADLSEKETGTVTRWLNAKGYTDVSGTKVSASQAKAVMAHPTFAELGDISSTTTDDPEAIGFDLLPGSRRGARGEALEEAWRGVKGAYKTTGKKTEWHLSWIVNRDDIGKKRSSKTK